MSTADVSVVYVTHRANPHFDWFADGLARQVGEDAVEVIVVDGRHSTERARAFAQMVDGRFTLRHVPPKPTPYSGPGRITRHPYSAASSARNTGIVYARAPYVVFTDDSGALGDGWWEEVVTAAKHAYVLAGTYENRTDLVVEDGRVLSGHLAPGAKAGDVIDSRWEIGDDHALVQIVGSQLFGCGLGAPRARLVALNGFDELCDPIGGEDYHLGVRLEWSGERLFFSRRMMTIKDADRHRSDAIKRLDRGRAEDGPLAEARYMACLGEFGVAQRTLAGRPWDCGHLCLDILYGTRSIRSLGNCYDLESLNEQDLAQVAQAFPERYWATGEPLAEL